MFLFYILKTDLLKWYYSFKQNSRLNGAGNVLVLHMDKRVDSWKVTFQNKGKVQ